MITVIIPTLNEQDSIQKLLACLCTYPSIAEILVIDGVSKDNTVGLVESFIAITDCKQTIRVLQNPNKLQAYALNLGLAYAANEFVVRIDAHTLIPRYDEESVDHFKEIQLLYNSGRYSFVGFRQRYCYINSIQCAMYIASFTPLLSRSLYRYAKDSMETYDTAWLFAVNRSLALQIGGFNHRVCPNEDYDFNQRIISQTGKPALIYPHIPIFYIPRSKVSAVFRQYFKYGSSRSHSYMIRKGPGKGTQLYYYGRQAIPLGIAALLAILYILFPIIYGFFVMSSIGIYTFSSLLDCRTFSACRTEQNRPIYVTFIAFAITPAIALVPSIAYSLGSLNFGVRNLFSIKNQ